MFNFDYCDNLDIAINNILLQTLAVCFLMFVKVFAISLIPTSPCKLYTVT